MIDSNLLRTSMPGGNIEEIIKVLIDSQSFVSVPVLSATVISVGDIVWLDSGNCKPASDFTWDTDHATTQALFADGFLGVAIDASAAGETEMIRVDTSPSSRHTFTVPSTTYVVGDELGCDENPSSKLSNTILEKVGSAALGIARSVEHHSSATTSLKVIFASSWHNGSANANASIG